MYPVYFKFLPLSISPLSVYSLPFLRTKLANKNKRTMYKRIAAHTMIPAKYLTISMYIPAIPKAIKKQAKIICHYFVKELNQSETS